MARSMPRVSLDSVSVHNCSVVAYRVSRGKGSGEVSLNGVEDKHALAAVAFLPLSGLAAEIPDAHFALVLGPNSAYPVSPVASPPSTLPVGFVDAVAVASGPCAESR